MVIARPVAGWALTWTSEFRTKPQSTPLPATLPALTTAGALAAADPLTAGAAEAAKRAFLVGLQIALSDADRARSAAAYLRSANGLTPAEQRDPTIAPLLALAHSILAKHRHSGFDSAA